MQIQTKYGLVGLVVNVHGRTVEEYPHGGQTYLWGNHGTEYRIGIQNWTGRDLEVVVSVDGIDVVDRSMADYAKNRGYLVPSRGSAPTFFFIPGFRLSDESIAKFKFGSEGESYAALSDRPCNIGVIGAAFFARRQEEEEGVVVAGANSFDGPPPMASPGDPFSRSAETYSRGVDLPGTRQLLDTGSRSRPAGRKRRVMRGVKPQGIGTVMGERTSHHVNREPFYRELPEDTPFAIASLQYRTKEQLQEMGIKLHVYRGTVAQGDPNPFPGSGR